MVEIAKAIGADARILIMDEPTASLTEREVDRLFAVIHLLREQDVGIIYISHRLDEISAIADRITVLRDGEAVATTASTGVDRAGLIRLMVGRELSSVFPKRRVDARVRRARGPPPLSSRERDTRHLLHRQAWRDLRPRRAGGIGTHRAGRDPLRFASCRRGRDPGSGPSGPRVFARPRDRPRDRLRTGGSPSARRDPRNVRCGEREPGQPAIGRAARLDRSGSGA